MLCAQIPDSDMGVLAAADQFVALLQEHLQTQDSYVSPCYKTAYADYATVDAHSSCPNRKGQIVNAAYVHTPAESKMVSQQS